MIRVAVRPYREPFARAIATARGLWTHREGAWIVAVDADGRVGLGELTPLPAWGTEDFPAALAAVPAEGPESIASEAWGLDPSRTPAAWAGLELALLDLASQRAGLSLFRHLGALLTPSSHEPSPSPSHPATSLSPSRGDRRASAEGVPAAGPAIPVNALLTGDSPDAVASAGAEALRAGFPAVKLKIGGRPLEADVARAIAVRAAIGPAVELRLDGNGGWSRADALVALRALAACRPSYVEQPVTASDLDGLVAVGRESGVTVAADEAAGDLASAIACLAAGVPVLVLKPAALGGLLATATIAREAARRGARVVLTSALDRGVGTLGAAHLAAALGLTDPMGLATGGFFAAPAVTGLEVAGGALAVPAGPGLGATPLEPALAASVAEARHG